MVCSGEGGCPIFLPVFKWQDCQGNLKLCVYSIHKEIRRPLVLNASLKFICRQFLNIFWVSLWDLLGVGQALEQGSELCQSGIKPLVFFMNRQMMSGSSALCHNRHLLLAFLGTFVVIIFKT